MDTFTTDWATRLTAELAATHFSSCGCAELHRKNRELAKVALFFLNEVARLKSRPGSAKNKAFKKLLTTPIEELEISVRLYNVLKTSGLLTLGAIVVKTEHELLMGGNCGQKSLIELRAALAEKELRLGMILSRRRS